ncbi:MAG: type II secretion system F family protein [Candidatus Aenigmatarchaeota archaeon]
MEKQEIRRRKKEFSISLTDWKVASSVGIAIGILILFINFQFLSSNLQLFVMLNMVAAVVALTIPIYVKYKEHSKDRSIEKAFLNFLPNLTENINVGMTLPQAIRMASKNDYNELTPYVKELSAKIDWGVSFEKSLEEFSKKTRSKVIRRTVRGIIEAHRSGGKIGSVLESISNSVQEVEKIKKERASRVYSQTLSGYFIFVLFVVIMFVLSKFLIPIFSVEGGLQGVENVQLFYQEMFRNLVIVQALFAGVGIGKMAEGTVVAGFKHSFVLAVVGYTILAI